MIKVQYPNIKPLLKKEGDKEKIFCLIRKRWVVLTPEEWVRQHFLLYLTNVLHFSASLIAVEKQIVMGEVKRRFDIVVYDKDTKPHIIVECKELQVPLTEAVLTQVLHYNASIRARFLLITNGSYTMGFEIKEGTFLPITELKGY